MRGRREKDLEPRENMQDDRGGKGHVQRRIKSEMWNVFQGFGGQGEIGEA